MRKKIAILGCALLMAVTIMPSNTRSIIAKTKTNEVAQKDAVTANYKTWYKDQLNDFGKKFYNALETMYKDGRLKTGIGEIDLSNTFNEADLKAYAGGKADIAKAFQAARDAFHNDYPEVFYVDFTKLTLRLGMQNGKYVLLLNNGTNKNYYAYGFTSTAQVETAVAETIRLKNEVKAVVSDDIKNNPVNVVSAVHNRLIELLDYTYPDGNDNTVSTVYGALKTHKANCDGYTRTFKWILDDFNIPNVYVAGVAKNARYEDKDDVDNIMGEAHAWNYVQIDGAWYAIDVTWDDPIIVAPANKEAKPIRTTYLLRGSDMMNENHFPMGQFSPEGQEFTYPELSRIDYEKTITKDDVESFDDLSTDLKVRVEKKDENGLDDEGNPKASTLFRLNYFDKTMKELNAEGYYLAYRGVYESGEVSKWYPADVIPNEAVDKELFSLNVWQPYIYQFCITKEKTTSFVYDTDLAEPGKNIVITQQVKAPYYFKYDAPPYVRTANPPLTETIKPVKTEYAIEFDQELVKVDNTKDVSINVTNSASHIDYKVENVKMKYSTYTNPDGIEKKSTIVTFSFTPDEKYQGYANTYRLQVENVEGAKSKKKPNSFPIITTYVPIIPCSIQVAHGAIPYTFVMSNPTLIVDQNLGNIFTAGSGSASYGALNIALIATAKTGNEKKALDDKLNDDFGINTEATGVKSSTYELNLSCKNLLAVIRPGYKVSVGVPYPEGFHPDDYEDGVEFRAYHYKKVNGVYTPIEIVCQITPSGLLISTNDFSPFTIVALPANDKNIPASTVADKAVSASLETAGGKIETDKGGAGLFTIAEGESRKFTIKPDDGYIIERIMINDKEVKVENNKSFETTFEYAKMAESNKLQVYFVAESVVQKEEKLKIDPIVPVIVDDNVLAPVVVYTERTLTSKTNVGNIDYNVTGSMIQDADLAINMVKLDAAAETAFKDYNKFIDAPIAAGVPTLSKEKAVDGDMTLKLNVGETYKDKTLTYLTLVNGKVVGVPAKVENGIITINDVKALQPFYVINEEVKLDKINELIKKCKALVEKDYTKQSYKALQSELKNTETILDTTEDMTQDIMQNVFNKLQTAYEGLVDVSLLHQAYSAYESLKYNDYTTESFAPIQAAAKAAERAFIDGTDQDVIKCIKDLNTAKSGLVAKNINSAKNLLNAMIDKAVVAQAMPGYDKVLPVYKANFENQLLNARAIALKYKDTNVDDENKTVLNALQNANSTLLDAMHYLSFKADKTILTTKYNEYKVIDLTKYKDDKNKAAFEAALNYANFVLEKNSALQEMIDLAVENLESSKNNLVLNGNPDADLDALNAAKAKAATIEKNPEKYDVNHTSWTKFKTAYDIAKKVDPKNQVAVDAAAVALYNAIAELRILPNQALADQMTAMVKQINALDLSLYSIEDQEFLLKTRVKVQNFGKEAYTQEELDEITAIMAQAQKVITDNVIEPGNPDPKPDPGNPDPNPEPGNPDPTNPPKDPVDPPKDSADPQDPAITPEVPVNGAIKPSTGDVTNISLAAGLMVSTGMIGFIAYRKKRNKASK